MSKRAELVEKYAAQIKDKLGMKPDMKLLEGVTKACGPSIYNNDSSKVSFKDEKEVARVKTNFIGKKLGITSAEKQDAAMKAVMDAYGKKSRVRYRAVTYYLLAKELRKASMFK